MRAHLNNSPLEKGVRGIEKNMNKSNYNKKLKSFARKLRNDSTPGEIKLWSKVLRAKQFYGLQFNRQYAINNFIVDFICRKLKLIIEIDGGSHQHKMEQDAARDNTLHKLGYIVIRVYETEVLNDINNVIRTIEAYLSKEILTSSIPIKTKSGKIIRSDIFPLHDSRAVAGGPCQATVTGIFPVA